MTKTIFINTEIILNVLLIAAVVACICIYFLVRIKKLKNCITDLQSKNEESRELVTDFNDENKQLAEDLVIQKQKNNDLISKLNREINISVNGILGMAALLKDTYLNKEQSNNVDDIINSGERLILNARRIFNGGENQNNNILNSIIMNDQNNEKLKQPLSPEFANEYPVKILVAEDDLINQHLAVKMLSKLGYKPDIVSTGKEALEVVSEKNYDLILMDGLMPEMDGFEATKMIRLCLETQPIIIALTASTMYGDKEKCLQAGMDDYLSKPIDINELALKIQHWATDKRVAVN